MKKKIFILSIILIAGLFILPARASMFDKGPSQDERTRKSKSASLIKAEKAFLKGEYEETILICNAYGSYRGKLDDELQLLTGKSLLKLNRVGEARNRFIRIINNSDSNKFLDKAYIGLADSYYIEGNYKEAKSYYEKMIRYFPDSSSMHVVYYKLGECYSNLDDKTLSKEYYDKLLRNYPESLETGILIGKKSDFVSYSVQAGSFAKWSNAKKLYDELNNKGFDVNIHTAIVGDSRFYRVRIGQYPRLSDAEEMARTLRNKGYTVKIYP